MADPRLRQMKIKTSVIKRIVREEASYITESEQQEARIERIKGEGADEYVLRKQHEVLEECRMMVPDCRRRLTIAHADLIQILKTQEDLAETEEYKEARTMLDSVKLEG